MPPFVLHHEITSKTPKLFSPLLFGLTRILVQHESLNEAAVQRFCPITSKETLYERHMTITAGRLSRSEGQK